MECKIIVIGGANADIAGAPSHGLRIKDSNIGRVSITPGGVARNIAENLVSLGAEVSLITAIGDDYFSRIIVDSCEKNNIDISMSRICKNERSSVYLYINDIDGDMYTAVNDMEIIEKITPEYLSKYIEKINCFDACVIDANITQSTLEYIAENVTVPIYADAVSVAKAERLKPVLNKLAAVKPNRYEYEILKPVPCRSYVTLGKDGMMVIDGDEQITIEAELIDAVDTNGCGDLITACIVFCELNGINPLDAARFAQKQVANKSRKK